MVNEDDGFAIRGVISGANSLQVLKGDEVMLLENKRIGGAAVATSLSYAIANA